MWRSRPRSAAREYERDRPLTGAERALLPDFLILFLLGNAAALVGDRLDGGAVGDAAVADLADYRLYERLAAAEAWSKAEREATLGRPPARGGPRRPQGPSREG